ncbi:helix-turn-helix domain-containing protein [Streptomyces sp. NPDC048664]|uniref:helix-turn-helix domain-containing protein n=1 Tax=Streptomyces sp. NPDC048664 TaxID=3154505 RepID=UPI0034382DBB
MRLRRAIVVMMSAQGQPVPDITSLMQVSTDSVHEVIHAFNERGLEAVAASTPPVPAPGTISSSTVTEPRSLPCL